MVAGLYPPRKRKPCNTSHYHLVAQGSYALPTKGGALQGKKPSNPHCTRPPLAWVIGAFLVGLGVGSKFMRCKTGGV